MRKVIGVTVVLVGLLIIGGALFGAGWVARGDGSNVEEEEDIQCDGAFENWRDAAQTPGITEAQLEVLENIFFTCAAD